MLQSISTARSFSGCTRYPARFFGSLPVSVTGAQSPAAAEKPQSFSSKRHLGGWLSFFLLLGGGGAAYQRLQQAITHEHEKNQGLERQVGLLQAENKAIQERFKALLPSQKPELQTQKVASTASLQELEKRYQHRLQLVHRQLAHLKQQMTQTHRKFLSVDASQGQLQDALKAMGGKMTLSDVIEATRQGMLANVDLLGKHGIGSGTLFQGTLGQDPTERYFILTNRHVVEGSSVTGSEEAPSFVASVFNPDKPEAPQFVQARLVKLSNGNWATSQKPDMALLEVTTPDFTPPKGFKNLVIRDTVQKPLQYNEPVIVMGCPFGFQHNTYVGGMSHPSRGPEVQDDALYYGYSGPLNPGDSGGTAVFANGDYAGIPTWYYEGPGGVRVENMGFIIKPSVVLDMLKTWELHLK